MKNPKIGVLGMCGIHYLEQKLGAKMIFDPGDVASFDMVIFSGGEDISPSIYGQKNLYSYGINLKRDALERAAFSVAMTLRRPVLGICRGHQLINAILGGTLYQDIHQELKVIHDHADHILSTADFNYWSNDSMSKFFPEVNSLHHQAVNRSGNGQYVICRSGDNIIEATTDREGLVVTVQFHPEFGGLGEKYFTKVLETGRFIWF